MPTQSIDRWWRASAAVLLLVALAGSAKAEVPGTAQGLPGLEHLPPDAREQAARKLKAVEQEVVRRRTTHPAAADVLSAELRRVRGLLSGELPHPAGDDPQVHVVGLYEPRHWRSPEVVEVIAGDRPVILVLCAYEPVRWEIRVGTDAKLRQVIAAGYCEQQVKFADPARAAPVELRSHEARDRDYFYAHEKDAVNYPRLIAALKQMTGQDVASFHGQYTGTGGPYQVGQGSPAWYAQVVETELEPLFLEATAPRRARPADDASTFRAVYFNEAPHPVAAQVPPMRQRPVVRQPVLADFTPAGPLRGSFRPLPRMTVQVAIDPRDHTVYAVTRSGVMQMPRGGGEVEPKIKGDVPRMSSLCGGAFDSKRRRLVVASSGGTGYLCAYSPEKGAWEFLAELNGLDLSGLAYSEKDDCFYGLCTRPEVRSISLCKISAEGDVLGSMPLPISSEPAPPVFGGPQVAMVGTNLAILLMQSRPVTIRPTEPPPRCVVVDPQDGSILSSALIKPRIAPAADFKADEVDRLWRLLGSAGVEEAEQAAERLAAGGDRAVAALRPRLAPAPPPDRDRVRQLVGQLSDADAAVRERATSDLIHAGHVAEPLLREAAKSPLPAEARSRLDAVLRELATPDAEREAAQRRQGRIVNVLQEIATPAAVEELIGLSAGQQQSPVTAAARAALREL